MKITDIFAQRKNTLVSIEIRPPERGTSIQELYRSLESLLEFKLSFIDVTYHQQEVIEIEDANSIKRIPIALKPGTVAISTAIKHKYDVETVPHIICGGFTK